MKVVYNISDNIISSLGFTTAENMESIYHGCSGVGLHTNVFGIPEPFQASLVPHETVDENFNRIADIKRYTFFERMVILSVYKAASHANVDLSSPDTLFVISTTKGNVYLLDPDHSHEFSEERVNLWSSAKEIASFFNNQNTPVVVSQACISGVSAILAGKMFLESGKYKNVVVTGGDMLSKFIVSGFQSFKALSSKRCRPFDSLRDGLSLGEGAGTMILGVGNEDSLPSDAIVIKTGATSNDANHISGPSRTGEGLYRAIVNTVSGTDAADLAFINAHGTATVYNDEMESIAISRAGLENVPVTSLKSYIGHTLGAAGLIETIACSHALLERRLITCQGFSNLGVSKNIKIITESSDFKEKECLKMVSGFGGCNAVVLLKRYN